MRRHSFVSGLIGLSILTGPSAVLAQKVAEGPPKVQEIRAVERGAFIEADVGATLMVNKLNQRSYGLGILTGLFVGYDIAPFLALSVGATAFTAPGNSEDPPPNGDLLFLSPMIQAQLAVITTERDFLWIRGAGGFGFGVPETSGGQAFGGNGPVFSGFVGYERFTTLRHFSVGIQGGVVGVTKPDFGITITISPTLKYTF